MKDNREVLRPYIADMAAIEKHLLEAIERQQKDDDITQFPESHQFLDRLTGTLREHVQTLEAHLDGFPGGRGAASTVKEAVAGALGAVASVYDKVRKDAASRTLRDDYLGLCLATIGYTMLYTTSLGLRQGTSAEIALRHLKDLTPLLVKLSDILPPVVLKELALEGYEVGTGLAQQAVRNCQEAWSSEHTRGGASGQVAAGTPTGVGLAGSYVR